MTPDEVFTETFYRLVKGWATLHSFREVSNIGVPAAASQVKFNSMRTSRYLMQQKEWSNFIKDPITFDNTGGMEGLATRFAEGALRSAAASVDAASLIFAHSIVDAAAAGFLRVTSMIAPKDWEQFVDGKKWSVSEVREQRYESLFAGLLLRELDQIERNTSLPRKGQRLLQLCRPDPKWVTPLDYDETRLVGVDSLRHDLLHKDLLGEAIPTIDDDLKFLEDLGWYFFVIVHNRYSAKLVFYE
jgi:hypothetical protein